MAEGGKDRDGAFLRLRTMRQLKGILTLGFVLAAPAAWAEGDDGKGDAGKSDQAKPLEQPTVAGPLKPNPQPAGFTAGPFGTINVSGVVTGYALRQDAVTTGDRPGRIDFSNLQAIVQKADGPLQFYVQTGLYAIPAIGLPTMNTFETTAQQFGYVPVIYAKVELSDAVSIQAGKLPTLIAGENTFTFQNLNIERGLLYGQSNNINKGVQVDLKNGGTTVSLSLNDGFYSDRLNWFIGALTQKFDEANTLVFSAGANLGRTGYETPAAPLLQNNSSIFNLSYTYKSGPWIVSPYVQVTHVPRDGRLGIDEAASTYGGALLASYALTKEFALAGRVEYIAQSGRRETGTTDLLYGPGSSALSLTLTPTYQIDRYFVRGEYSYVRALNATAGSAFGRAGNRTQQNRFALETGILF